MRWCRFSLAALLLLCGTSLLDRASAGPHPREEFQSFYVARFFFSDYLPGWSNTILDVAPQGNDVRVRVIRISLANDFCPGLIVRAAEHVFRQTTVRRVAGEDMCAFTSDHVDGALKAATQKFVGDPSDSATETIVAQCDRHEKEFDFPYPVDVDQKDLKRSHPDVSHLWDTFHRVFEAALGKNFSFGTTSPEQQRGMQDLGTKLVPELISGKYQTAYNGSQCDGHDCDNYLAWQLKGYSGAPERYDPAVATLLDEPSLHLTKYLAPVVPSIAKTAHVYGDVHLRITADRQTGAVENVDFISGPQLLERSALAAAKSWQFDPATLSPQPIEVTLRFELKCR